MKKSNELLGRYGDLKYDIELAIYKLIKKDARKHIEGIRIKELDQGCYVDVYIGEKGGNRAVIAKCDDCYGAHSIEMQIKDMDIESGINILVGLEDAYQVED